MDSCEEHVIIECGLYILSEERKLVKLKYWINKVFLRARRGRRISHSPWRSEKVTGKNFSNILECIFRKLKHLKSFCPKTIKRRTHNGDVTQKMRHANFNLHIPYNLLFPSSLEQLNTPQKALAFWLINFVNDRVECGRSGNSLCLPQAVHRRPISIPTYHVLPMSHLPVLCRGLEKSLSQRRNRSTAGYVRIKHVRTE